MFLRRATKPKAARRRANAERARIEGRYGPSARELFPVLRERLLASRPVLGTDRARNQVYGAPTFRNVINERGEHV